MISYDLAALFAAASDERTALCTLVGLEGSFSRRIGAQIAIDVEGNTVGSLSDGCLERQLATEARTARETGERRLLRFGAGSPMIDFRLPCGSGLDILIDPAPGRAALADAVGRIGRREEASIALPLPADAAPGLITRRRYIPPMGIVAFGEGPELSAFRDLAAAMGIAVQTLSPQGQAGGTLALGRVPQGPAVDAWTAILLLFHDHEWERTLLHWSLETPAFYIGAQGGATARDARKAQLLDDGLAAETIARLRSPIGLIAGARDPQVLAVSVMAEIVAAYEMLHPHR